MPPAKQPFPVMVLAAGRGSRLAPETNTCPKPLIKVGEHPLIVWHLLALKQAGFQEIVINISYKAEQIQEALGNGNRFGLQLRYSFEPHMLGTAGGIFKALAWLGTGPFLVVNSDIRCSIDFVDLAPLATKLCEENLLGWGLLVPNPPHRPQGDFLLVSNRIQPRPAAQDPNFQNACRQTPLTFSGIGLYQTTLFSELYVQQMRDVAEHQPHLVGNADVFGALGPLLGRAAQKNRLGGSLFGGRWVDVGTPERLALARSMTF